MAKEKNIKQYQVIFIVTFMIVSILRVAIPKIDIDTFQTIVISILFTGLGMLQYLIDKLEQ